MTRVNQSKKNIYKDNAYNITKTIKKSKIYKNRDTELPLNPSL
jgi:hypothetical protein